MLPLLDGCETKYAAKDFTFRDQEDYRVCYNLPGVNSVTLAVGNSSLHTWLQGLLKRAHSAGLVVVGNTGGPEHVLMYLEDLEDGQVRGGLHVSAEHQGRCYAH